MPSVHIYDKYVASCHPFLLVLFRGWEERLMSRQGKKTLSLRTLDPATFDINADDALGKRHQPLEKGDCRPSVEDTVEKQTKKTRHACLHNMDAIAFGVQARFEENNGFSRRVTETTVDIARELGIPEDEIERWAVSRLTRLIRETERLNAIKSLLERPR